MIAGASQLEVSLSLVQIGSEVRPKPYNPCADGFAAKAWECLRRNQSFREAFNRIIETKEPDKQRDEKDIAEYEAGKLGNYLARLIFSKYRNWKLNKCWSMQPKIDRTAFAALFSQGGKLDLNEEGTFSGAEPTAYQPARFNLDDIYKRINSGDRQLDADKAITALTELDALWSHYDLIAVPKMIRHDKHRDKILNEIAALIPESPFKGITCKPTGSTLCTEQEWNTFLDYEEWNRLGFERQDAANLAAERQRVIKAENPLYGVEATQGTDVERKKAAKNFLNKKKPHAHRTRAEERISNVEKAIVSVFPSFSLFSSK